MVDARLQILQDGLELEGEELDELMETIFCHILHQQRVRGIVGPCLLTMGDQRVGRSLQTCGS